MSKPTNKRASKAVAARPAVARPSRPTKIAPANDQKGKGGRSSKQARVVEMLRSSTGTTVAAVMKATGWQQHSVRGFLAGVVRKRLKLKLSSEKTGGHRVYRIASGKGGRAGSRQSKRPSR